MKTCVVPFCYSTSTRNPELRFFSFPKHTSVKEEWLEVLSLKKNQVTDLTKICELHFKSKDFCAGKKSLKTHAIPVHVKGRTGSFDPDNSEDEFMHCDSDSDPEILEVKKISQQSINIKQEIKCEPNIKEEPKDEVEPEYGRRPSRRAAQLAVKKIQNTVRNLGIPTMEIPIQKDLPKVEARIRRSAPSTRGQSKKFRDHRLWHSIRIPPVDIDLLMECHEELLSPTQAETLVKAQTEYNSVMKTLRTLKASNARIICMLNDDPDPPPPIPPSSTLQPKIATIVSTAPGSLRTPNLVTLTPATIGQSSANTITVVPVRLVTVHTPMSSGLQSVSIMRPSSPSVTLTATSRLIR